MFFRAILLTCINLAAFVAVCGADLRYEISAQLVLDEKLIRAHATMTIPSDFLDVQGRISLDAESAGVDAGGKALLHVNSISTIANERLRWTSSGGTITVELPREARASTEIPLVVDYTVPLDQEALKAYGYYLLMGVDPGSFWYPDVIGPGGDRPRFRDFDVTLKHPRNMTVVTSGAPHEVQTVGADSLASRWVATHVEGFALAMGEGFVQEQVAADGTAVILFCEPQLVETYRKIAGYAAEAVGWYKQTYGFFPVKRTTILQGHSLWAGGYPLPNAFMVHRGKTDPEFMRWITAHELGHYYWGLYVLGSTERLDWLQLANGIWADQLYMAEKTGRTIEEQWRAMGNGDWFVDYFSAMLGNHPQSLDIPPEEADNLGFDYNSLVRHGKGAVGLYLQARGLGKEKFLDLQRSILKDYKYRPLPLSDFIERIEKSGAEGATGFFNKWRRGDACINYSISVDKMERHADIMRYALALTQDGTVPYPVTVEAEDERGRKVRVEGHGGEDVEALTVDLNAPLSRLRLDPDGIVPSLNASNPAMQLAILRALWNENLMPMFRMMAASYLREHPGNAEARLLVIADAFTSARYRDITSLLTTEDARACSDLATCRAAILLARAMARIEKEPDASGILDAIRPVADRLGLKRRWQEAFDEIGRH
ncbi:MAG: hypothetical protein AB1714_21790 [Acidobacteriota bacterium]